MYDILIAIGNMSLTGSIVILLVLLGRLLMRRSPKKYAYGLWSVVLFRLLCPMAFTADFSLIGWIRSHSLPKNLVSSLYTVRIDGASADGPTIAFQTAPVLPAANPEPIPPVFQAPVNRLNFLGYLWLAGVLVLFLFGLVQYIRLRRSLTGAARRTGNVYLADHISTPFVLGLFRPRIYLPSGLPREEQRFILAHERQHIHRMDPLWKFLGYAALCLHWFNPLVWLAFSLAGKDMEMSCDEAVITAMGPEIRADYAQALLQLATHKTRIAGMPLAFGEGDTKGRVKNLVKWKRPKVWVSALCGAACILLVLLCIFNSRQKFPESSMDGPASIGIMDFNFNLPEGCTYQKSEDILKADWTEPGTFALLAGGKEIGGVRAFPIPEDLTDYLWAKLPLTEWQDESLGHFGDNDSLEFFSDVPPGEEKSLHRLHHFYVYGNQIYDLWFDLLTASEDIQKAILDSVQLGSSGWQINDLPAWVHQTEEGNAQNYYKGSALVGQLISYRIPEGVFDPIDSTFAWLEKMEIPDLHDPNLFYAGGITTGDWGWKAKYVSQPGAQEEVERTHWFFPSGNTLFDLWVDSKTLSEQEQFAFVNAFSFHRPQVKRTEATAEDTAFAKCREVMEYAMEKDVGIHSVLTYETHPEKNVTRDYWSTESGDLLQTIATQNTATAVLAYQDWYFSGADTGSGMQWSEADFAAFYGPWLNSFDFIRKFVTYEDTRESDALTCYRFRADVPLCFEEELCRPYYPSFYFDKDGNFLRVEIQGNLLQEDALTLVESIAATDSGVISQKIENAYREAAK